MATNQLYLFKDRRFLPIFLVQFFGCLNDNIIKNALIILITFKLTNDLNTPVYLLIMLANVIFIMPFVLFASLAGQLADRYERSLIVQIIKAVEIAIVLLSAYGFYTTNLVILFLCIGLMGVHSTFFGPIKYSVLPDHIKKDELLAANGFFEAGTFLSILFGTILGGFYNINHNLVIITGVIISILGLISAFFMPKSYNSNPTIKINLNIITATKQMLRYASSKNNVYLSILGISWFWFIGAAILAQIPSLTRDVLKADENVANLFLATFSIGVGVGSFLCNKLFANKISTKYVFVFALGISVCCYDLYFSTTIATTNYEPEQLKTIVQFLSKGHYWRILIDLFCLACIGGLYVVPLFAVMQYCSSPAYRSRVIAANNFINSFFMAGSTGLLSFLFFMEFSIPSVILMVGILNMIIATYIYQFIPNSQIVPMVLWRAIFRFAFHNMYKVEVKGIENYRKAGKRTVIVANHLSYLDPALIASYIPENIKFAVNLTVAKEWWVKPFLKIVKTYPIESNSPMAIKSLIAEVKKDQKIAIFPEGRTSLTGSLMKIYEGPGMIADKAGATLLPIRVDGTQFTIFSKVRRLMGGKFCFRRKITITILPPVTLDVPKHLDNRGRRKYLGEALYNIMSEMIFESSNYQETLFHSLINASKIYGKKTLIMQDIENNTATYNEVVFKSLILANLVSKNTDHSERVGLMLPNMVTSTIAFLAVQVAGRIPAMINYTAGAGVVISACKVAQLKIIYTSRKFIKKAALGGLVSDVKKTGVKFIYLEDLRKSISLLLKIKCIAASFFPLSYYNRICSSNYSDTAVILFTSGTELEPKAVALSHQNIQANKCQVLSRIDFNPYDSAFNALPMFHTFGLTATLIMCLNGVRTFFYPSPLHYRVIPEIIYDIGATIMFGTDTFLSRYAAYAHPYDFYSLRYVVAGSEKLKPKTRQMWLDKFGIRIFEGYGVTEAAPVIALNTPMHDKPGSVGRFLPKIEYQIKAVEGIEYGGKLCIRGPNIMQGYITKDNPGIITSPWVDQPGDNWYDTGDIVSVDDEGYIKILGREKRFAKIAGEMISLAVVEDLLYRLDPEFLHAVISIADEAKGEKLIALTTSKNISSDKILLLCHQMQLSELYLPKIVKTVKELPVLVTGKVDYRKILQLSKEIDAIN